LPCFLIVCIRFSTLTVCLSSMFLSGLFHGKFYRLFLLLVVVLLWQVRWHEKRVNLSCVPWAITLLTYYLILDYHKCDMSVISVLNWTGCIFCVFWSSKASIINLEYLKICPQCSLYKMYFIYIQGQKS